MTDFEKQLTNAKKWIESLDDNHIFVDVKTNKKFTEEEYEQVTNYLSYVLTDGECEETYSIIYEEMPAYCNGERYYTEFEYEIDTFETADSYLGFCVKPNDNGQITAGDIKKITFFDIYDWVKEENRDNAQDLFNEWRYLL